MLQVEWKRQINTQLFGWEDSDFFGCKCLSSIWGSLKSCLKLLSCLVCNSTWVSKTPFLHPLLDTDEDSVFYAEAPVGGKHPWFLNWTQTVKLAVVLPPAVLCVSLVSLQSWRVFLEVCWLLRTSMGDGNGASLNQRGFPHDKSVLGFLSELQIFLHLILRSPLPHWGHWQPCLSLSFLVLSRMGGPGHFGPQAF